MLKTHERMALAFLKKGPDRIRIIEDEPTFAAAITYCNLAKSGFVAIDNEDGMLVTITPAGIRALTTGQEK